MNSNKRYHLFSSLSEHSSLASNGVLELKWSDKQINLLFKDGKIVGCESEKLKSNMINRIRSDYQVKNLKSDIDVFNKSIQESICSSYALLPHELANLQKDLEISEIEKIAEFEDGNLNFKKDLLENGRNYLFDISPSQLMLDFIEKGHIVNIKTEEVASSTYQKKSTDKLNAVNLGAFKDSKNKKIVEEGEDKQSEKIQLKNNLPLQEKAEKLFYFGFGISLLIFSVFKINADMADLYSLLVKLS